MMKRTFAVLALTSLATLTLAAQIKAVPGSAPDQSSVSNRRFMEPTLLRHAILSNSEMHRRYVQQHATYQHGSGQEPWRSTGVDI